MRSCATGTLALSQYFISLIVYICNKARRQCSERCRQPQRRNNEKIENKMNNVAQFENSITAISEDVKEVVFKFFVTFSRLECALKNVSQFLLTKSNSEASVNWTEFDKYIVKYNSHETQDVKKAVDYIMCKPPAKQVVENGKLDFKEVNASANEIPVYIRRIRNNLFHGGKFNGKDVSELARDLDLLRNSIVIMEYWISSDSEIRHNYLS